MALTAAREDNRAIRIQKREPEGKDLIRRIRSVKMKEGQYASARIN